MKLSANYGLSLAFLLLGACASRTSPATQPTPALFDATTSDAKAVALVDAMVTKLGGAEAWAKVKEVKWELKYIFDGEVKFWFRHSWDRWNGRHRLEVADMETYKAAKAGGDMKLLKFRTSMYDLFDTSKRGYATYGGKEVSSDSRKQFVAFARTRWKDDSYQLSALFKLKDPGVKLKHVGSLENVAGGYCKPSCDTVQVTFVDQVGNDTFYVNINKDTGLPEIWEKKLKAGRVAYHLEDWVEVDGLKFPTKFQNIGQTKEVYKLENIKLGSPDDSDYMRAIR